MKRNTVKSISMLLAVIMLFSTALLAVGCNGDEPVDTTAEETTPAPEDTAEPSLPEILESDLSKYYLIRPEKASDKICDQTNVLFQKLMASTPIFEYRDDFYREDVPSLAISEFEILVGKTNRPESIQFLSDLKYNDYGFAQIGKKIVIAGHSDQATYNAIQEFIFTVIHNKDSKEGVFYTSEYDFLKKLDYKIGDVKLGEVSLSEYRIVYPAKNRYSERIAAQNIADKLANVSGIVLDVVTDAEENGVSEYEILVGSTNRHTEAESSAIVSGLGANDAVIKYDGKKVGIFGATATALMVAASDLYSRFDAEKTDVHKFTLEAETLCKYNDSILSAMSFNVWVSSRTQDRVDRVVKMVTNYLPDTIGFQEVNAAWLGALRDGLKTQYAYVGEGRDGGVNGEYNPIFYKKDVFNLLESGTKWLSDTPDKVSKVPESSLNRIYTYALLERKSDGVRIMVVNTHFDHTSAQAREKQADVLVDYLKTIINYPIVLTGDFNCESSSSAYSKIISGGVKNSYDIADKRHNKDATYTNYGQSNKIIDFAFVNPKFVSVSSYRVCSEMINGDYPSDHHPVVIEYAIIN